MADVPLGRADYHRSVAKEARVQTRNRYFEANPVLTGTKTAMIARPALRRWLSVGEGPIRGIYSQPGSFNGALFVVSGSSWYRIDRDATVTLITPNLFAGTGAVSMAATGTIGDVPEMLWLADGGNLWLYMGSAFAEGTISGSAANGDKVQIGTVWYQFTTGSVDAGTHDGTNANPYLVKKSLLDRDTWQSFAYAVTGNGGPGDDYSTGLQANTSAQTIAVGVNSVTVRANIAGVLGNDVATTETGAAMAWTAATLTGGGQPLAQTVDTPGDVAPISVGYCSSYIIVIPAQGAGINGRFWWIAPGETTIDPLDYATAERAPDPVFAVVVFGDQFWLPGSNTTEVWYFTGNADSPVLRLQGITFDRGTWEGAAIQVKESMVIVDSDGGVFQISGGLKRISTPDIEERIHAAIAAQAARIVY